MPGILITGGYPMSNFRSVELFSPGIMNQTCVLPDLPDSRLWHTSDGMASGVFICGGLGSLASTSCITISGGHWIQSHSLLYPR